MNKKIKICGLRSAEDIRIVNELKPDFIGYIFYPKSKRFITYAKAALLNHLLDDDIKSVGVFVNEKISRIIEAVRVAELDIVQLHGEEDKTYIDLLRKAVSCEIINVVRVGDEDFVFQETDVDYNLFDTKVKGYGGEGATFEWDRIKSIQTDKPIILAGGIGPANINEALHTNADIIDLSSSVEVEGKKSYELVKTVIEAVRRYEL